MGRKMKLFAPVKRIAFLLISSIVAVLAEDARDKQLNDRFLDQLVGEWHVTRNFPKRPRAENVVRVQWTLNHQWLELQYRDIATPSKYEADVFIGFDAAKKQYVCHWMDNFGGAYSAMDWGKIDDKMLSLEFKFGDELTNRFTFDPKSKNWTSLIRQVEHGEWTTFCEDKFARADAKK